MNHKLIKEKLYTFLDKELSEQEHQEISLHIEECSECKDDLKLWQATGRLLSFIPEPVPSEKIMTNVMKSVSNLSKENSFDLGKLLQFRWLAPSLSVGVAALFLCFAFINNEVVITTENILLASLSSDDAMSSFFSSGEQPDIELLVDMHEENL